MLYPWRYWLWWTDPSATSPTSHCSTVRKFRGHCWVLTLLTHINRCRPACPNSSTNSASRAHSTVPWGTGLCPWSRCCYGSEKTWWRLSGQMEWLVAMQEECLVPAVKSQAKVLPGKKKLFVGKRKWEFCSKDCLSMGGSNFHVRSRYQFLEELDLWWFSWLYTKSRTSRFESYLQVAKTGGIPTSTHSE